MPCGRRQPLVRVHVAAKDFIASKAALPITNLSLGARGMSKPIAVDVGGLRARCGGDLWVNKNDGKATQRAPCRATARVRREVASCSRKRNALAHLHTTTVLRMRVEVGMRNACLMLNDCDVRISSHPPMWLTCGLNMHPHHREETQKLSSDEWRELLLSSSCNTGCM